MIRGAGLLLALLASLATVPAGIAQAPQKSPQKKPRANSRCALQPQPAFPEARMARSPRDADARARLGHALLELRDFPAAQRELLTALEVEPKRTDTWRDLLSAYFLAENYPAALAALDQLDKRETPRAPAWFVRAICYDKLRRKPEALEAYQKFIELDGGRDADQNFQARQRIRILRNELHKK